MKGYVLLALVGMSAFSVVWGLSILPNLIPGYNCGTPVQQSTTKTIALINDLWDDPGTVLNATLGRIAATAGYGYDYYGFSQAGVNLFLHLAQKGYSIVLLRTHGTNVLGAITTSDSYTTSQWVGDQLSGSVTRVRVNGTDREYFGLTSKFLAQTCGDYHGALLLAMGCYGTQNTDLSSAFIQKGTGAFVGWDNSVSLARTDSAATLLVQQMVQGQTLGNAVHDVMTTVGPEPGVDSQLLYYPGTASTYSISS